MAISSAEQEQFMEETMQIHDELFPTICNHIAIVSINDTDCQCMDCLCIWIKEPGFLSDYPQHDRG